MAPSAFPWPCGLVGLKPTWGRVSRFSVFPNGASMDHVDPMARTVSDVAALLQVISGPDEKDSTAVPLPVPDYLAALSQFACVGQDLPVDRDERFARQFPTRSRQAAF